mmetsp:Transcript_29645/g.96562  ORF Transcript_29645/g.96562 Transcript_29645/m.96562 type:complete len:316 (-) Transcript_29645:825-1772(-)
MPGSSWMWPKMHTAGRTSRTRSYKSWQPTRLPSQMRSPWPNGGPWQMRTSQCSGIERQCCFACLPRSSWNANPVPNLGVNGEPWNTMPSSSTNVSISTIAPACSSIARAWSLSSILSNAVSWLPGTTTMCLYLSRCFATHKAKRCTSASVPRNVMSPACTRTSAGAALQSSCLPCVSETTARRMAAGGGGCLPQPAAEGRCLPPRASPFRLPSSPPKKAFRLACTLGRTTSGVRLSPSLDYHNDAGTRKVRGRTFLSVGGDRWIKPEMQSSSRCTGSGVAQTIWMGTPTTLASSPKTHMVTAKSCTLSCPRTASK